MGWTFMHREPGMTDREFFTREFGLDRPGPRRMLDGATVGGAFYAAITHDDGTVYAAVILVRRSRGYENFAYKDMTETMGPGEAACPARILDLLTPLPDCDHDDAGARSCGTCWARDWRSQCREAADRRQRARAVKPGTLIRFPRPLHFTNGHEATDFELVERNVFRDPATGYRYRVPDWRTGPFEVLAP